VELRAKRADAASQRIGAELELGFRERLPRHEAIELRADRAGFEPARVQQILACTVGPSLPVGAVPATRCQEEDRDHGQSILRTMWSFLSAACLVPCGDGEAMKHGECFPAAGDEPAYDFSTLGCDVFLEETGGVESPLAIDVHVGGTTTICGGLHSAGHTDGHFTGDVDSLDVSFDVSANVIASLASEPDSEVHAYFFDRWGDELGTMSGPEPMDSLTMRPRAGETITIDLAGYQGSGGAYAITLETRALLFTGNVTAGYSTACTVLASRDVQCWGEKGDEVSRAGVGAMSAAVGSSQVCGLTATGVLRCWGTAGDPYEAAGTYTGVAVNGYSRGYALCALDAGGVITCWDDADVSAGGVAPGLAGGPWRDVSTGFNTTCAVDAEGRVACAGKYLTDAPDGAFQKVEVAQGLACGLTTEGSIVCWADKAAYGSAEETAALVPEGSGFEDVAIGFEYVCGLRAGDVSCWGLLAKSVPANTAFTSVTGGNNHACGVRDDGAVACWGLNRGGVVSDTP
jgi:hypothetical protein